MRGGKNANAKSALLSLNLFLIICMTGNYKPHLSQGLYCRQTRNFDESSP
jgi:hypothetical protein